MNHLPSNDGIIHLSSHKAIKKSNLVATCKWAEIVKQEGGACKYSFQWLSVQEHPRKKKHSEDSECLSRTVNNENAYNDW